MPWEKNIILAISYKNHRKRSFAYSRDPLYIIIESEITFKRASRIYCLQ